MFVVGIARICGDFHAYICVKELKMFAGFTARKLLLARGVLFSTADEELRV